MMKLIRTIHLWLSIPFGLIICIMCVSGAFLVFERDFGVKLASRVEAGQQEPLPMAQLLATAAALPEAKAGIKGVTVYPDPQQAYKFSLTKPAMAAVLVDQYTGQSLGKYERPKVFTFMSSAHRRLWDKSKMQGNTTGFGRLIIGITTIMLVLIVATGLILWYPKNKIQAKHSFTVPTGKGKFAFWHALHSVGGFWTTLILLICAFTGLTFSFPWAKNATYAVLGAEAPKKGGSTPSEEPASYVAWQKAFDAVKAQNPGREIRVYEGRIDVMHTGWGNRMAYDSYVFDPESGSLTGIKSYDDQDRSTHIKGWIYSLHTGSWGQMPVKLLYALLMIISFSLPLTGYYLWIHRLRSRRHKKS